MSYFSLLTDNNIRLCNQSSSYSHLPNGKEKMSRKKTLVVAEFSSPHRPKFVHVRNWLGTKPKGNLYVEHFSFARKSNPKLFGAVVVL